MKLNNCPICGHMPIIFTESLDRGNGHGYPGHSTYYVECSNEQCPLSREDPRFEYNDIYCDKDEVYEDLIAAWNENVVKVNELILNK